jgi:hypothetical protein
MKIPRERIQRCLKTRNRGALLKEKFKANTSEFKFTILPLKICLLAVSPPLEKGTQTSHFSRNLEITFDTFC